MKKCPYCKSEIDDGASICSQCKKDLRKWFVRHWILTIFIILIILGIIGSSGENNKKTEILKQQTGTATTTKVPEKIEPLKVSAIDLSKAYVDNEVKADKEYKDKVVEISGKIKDIGVIFGKTYITLSSGNDFSLTDIQCFFEEKSEIDKVANLKKGDSVKVIGKLDGKSMNVGVNNCILK